MSRRFRYHFSRPTAFLAVTVLVHAGRCFETFGLAFLVRSPLPQQTARWSRTCVGEAVRFANDCEDGRTGRASQIGHLSKWTDMKSRTGLVPSVVAIRPLIHSRLGCFPLSYVQNTHACTCKRFPGASSFRSSRHRTQLLAGRLGTARRRQGIFSNLDEEAKEEEMGRGALLSD